MLDRLYRVTATIEGLENRWLLSRPAPITKFSQPAFYFNDIAQNDSGGSGTSVTQFLVIRNAGTLPLIFNSKGLRIQGDNPEAFVFTGKKAPATIQPGASRTIPIVFKSPGEGIFDAILLAKSNDHKHKSVSIPLRGLGTRGEGGDKEPALQQILDLYQIPETTGDSNPNDTNFKVPPSTPNDEVDLQQLVKADPTQMVRITPLANFVNDFGPAVKVGWYGAGQPELVSSELYSVPSADDSQSVAPRATGKFKFDPGTRTFGLYAAFPAFSYRKSLSEDALNTWEPKNANRRKFRFYPLKDADGTVVPNAYVFAAEDYNVTYDFNDIVGIIRNVKPAPAVQTIGIQNADGTPAFDRLVFDRITNLDPIRPNVVHDKSTLEVLNSGGSTLTISSMKLSDNVNFKIVSGGGSNIKLAPHSGRNVTIQFVANPASGFATDYNATLTITSDDPKTPTRIVNLAGLWQNSSEKTASNKYSEPSLKSLVNNTFGYTTTIVKPGQTTNHGGHPVPVGDEILDPYWLQADPSAPINVRQLAAFHRQNNFDDMGNPITAASNIGWYFEGHSTTVTKLFTHNIDEGQSLLPHISGSSTNAAQKGFRPGSSTPFGFVVDKHFTDDSLNQLDFNPSDPNQTGIPGTGHSFRIFPLKDENGKAVPNSYIFAMDYTANIFANWDYNDNLYLVSNVKPAPLSATPMAVRANAPASLFTANPVDASESVDLDRVT
jgi:hypothetical protein